MSESLRPHESQHARPPCPSPTPGVLSDSRPSSQWCHPAISSSVVFFSSCPQSLPASESFPMSQLFAWGGQSTGVSALASVLLSSFQTGNTVSVTVVTLLCITSLWMTTFTHFSQLPPHLHLRQPPVYTVSTSSFVFSHTNWDHMVLTFHCLIFFT